MLTTLFIMWPADWTVTTSGSGDKDKDSKGGESVVRGRHPHPNRQLVDHKLSLTYINCHSY